MELDSLYQEVILDHYRNPLHKGLSKEKDIQVHHNNPSCGDEVTLNLIMKDGFVKDISWDGVGCSISMASTSVMSDLLIGKNYADALKIVESFVELMQSKPLEMKICLKTAWLLLEYRSSQQELNVPY
jgi:nitrogen fixation NifU-like protein